MKLNNLPGTTGADITCLFIEKSTDIKVVLNNGFAATSADDNGALNVWKDDEGII